MDAFNQFFCRTQSVFQTSAVFVFPAVVESHAHLVQQIAPVHRMHLNTVITAFLGDGSTFDHVGDLLPDLFLCQFG